MNHQAICQKCGAANPGNAVVCTQCGVKLDHRERRLFNRMKADGTFARIAAWPGKMLRKIFRNVKVAVTVIGIFLIIIVTMLLMMLFLPIGWPEYQRCETPRNEEEQKRFAHAIGTVVSPLPGEVYMDPYFASMLANHLIYKSGDLRESLRKKRAYQLPPAVASQSKSSGNEKLDDAHEALMREMQSGYCAVTFGNDNQFVMVFTGKFRGKMPWRILMKFEGIRAEDGRLSLRGFQIGNMPVPRSLAEGLAVKLMKNCAAGELLSFALNRIEGGTMRVSGNGQTNGDFTIRLKEISGKKGKK